MEQAYVPMHFLKNLVHLVADEEDIAVASVVRNTGVSQSVLEQEGAFATDEQSRKIYERVAELSTIPGIGFRSPSAMSFADQGMLGALMIMAPTVGEAFQKLSKFIDLVGGTVAYKFREQAGKFVLTTEDKDVYTPVAHQLIAEENLAIWKFTSLPVLGLESYLKELRLDYPKPKNWRMYSNLFPNCDIKFAQREIAAVLSPDIVHLPIPTSNPEAFRKMESVCEELLLRIRPNYKNYVMDFLEQSNPSEWSVRNVVDALNTTHKSLTRRLKEEGVTPKEMIAEQKKKFATAQMARGVSDAKIAVDLGYADSSSFARGFKSWTGATPAQYRKKEGF